ncbi:UTP:RNA uridylyltransferase 1-like isoform X2 [Cornus florida]|uniref:UTP:RNA uridylyltransferase 1-like isoform X2 n=1 Tax=Cornus florida TaxID=4283 RepID=UPI0028A11BC8|nr:UTP:RNA uridylyltransferase 1-like isoform X2 [Cornus florida]
MGLGEKVLRKKARKLELKELQKNSVTPGCISQFDELLYDVYVTRLPKSRDYNYRRDLVRIFNEIAKEIYGKSDNLPLVEEFGSFLMDIFSAKSDLDLSVNFCDNVVQFPREKKVQTLRKFAKKLYALQRQGHVSGVRPITSAKVPILKVVDCGTGIECDISVENRDGIVKSKIVRMVSSIDKRFQKLSFLMKAWAKAQGINSSKDRTLNSLSIISLVAFHLQTRDPPILPPFSVMLGDGTHPAKVEQIVHNFSNYGKRNKETLAELFASLLIKLASVETLWPKGLCVSTYEGSWISKTWDSKDGCISVEDFTDRSQNVARAVGSTQMKKIYKCIHVSIWHVLSFMKGKIQVSKLRECLFGPDPIPNLVGKGNTNFNKNVVEPRIPIDSIQTKKMRRTDGWEGIKQMREVQSVEGWGGGTHAKGWGGAQTEGWKGIHAKGWEKTRTEGWGGTHTKGWGGAQTEGWKGIHAKGWVNAGTEGWGGTHTKSWGGTHTKSWGGIHAEGWEKTGTEGWGGTHTKSWGGTYTKCWEEKQQYTSLYCIGTKTMRPKVSWGGAWQAIPLDPTQAEEIRSAEGWEAK